MTNLSIKPINWNRVEDPVALEVWNKLTNNFWLPEKIPLSNDNKSWSTLTQEEKDTVNHVFAGLTTLDTVQAQVGAISLMEDARSQQEEAVYTNIAFMESVHAKSYSSIYTTLNSSDTINEIFRWAENNEFIQKKESIILSHYHGDDPLKRKIASVMLESFLFYSGFYLPLWWSSRGQLTNVADLIRLIIRDEAIHGFAIGHWFQQGYQEQSPSRQEELKEFAYMLLLDLMDNEVDYTELLYDDMGLTEDVKKFLKYNANKALMNLGFDALYSRDESTASAAVMSALSPNANENHDFFSGSGSSYVMGKAEDSEDEDWDWAF